MRILSVVAMIPVTDMPRSLAFYQQLGFDVENDFIPPGQTTAAWAWLDGGGGMIMLQCSEGSLPAGRRAVGRTPTGGRGGPGVRVEELVPGRVHGGRVLRKALVHLVHEPLVLSEL